LKSILMFRHMRDLGWFTSILLFRRENFFAGDFVLTVYAATSR
jgi:hypothetical protein